MSLLLLFPRTSPAVVAVTPSPAVIQTIDTVKPTLVYVESSGGVFTDSSVAYSSSSVTYNDTNTFYGGSNPTKSNAPVVYNIDTVRPEIYSIDKE